MIGTATAWQATAPRMPTIHELKMTPNTTPITSALNKPINAIVRMVVVDIDVSTFLLLTATLTGR